MNPTFLICYHYEHEGRLLQASVREISIVLKVAIVLIGALSTLVALITPDFTIYGLFILAADIVFAGILPQLTCSLFVPFANGYGAICGKSMIALALLTNLFIRMNSVLMREMRYWEPCCSVSA